MRERESERGRGRARERKREREREREREPDSHRARARERRGSAHLAVVAAVCKGPVVVCCVGCDDAQPVQPQVDMPLVELDPRPRDLHPRQQPPHQPPTTRIRDHETTRRHGQGHAASMRLLATRCVHRRCNTRQLPWSRPLALCNPRTHASCGARVAARTHTKPFRTAPRGAHGLGAGCWGQGGWPAEGDARSRRCESRTRRRRRRWR